MKKRILLLFGGRSGEHEVSLQSAKSIYEALDKEKYEVFLVGVDKTGRWLLGRAANYLLNAENPKLIKLNISAAQTVLPIQTNSETILVAHDSKDKLGTVDVVFPIIHGTYGEDGSLQGLLEWLDVAYVGAGVLGSAVGMDKAVMKKLLRDAGLPIVNFFELKTELYNEADVDKIINNLSWPVFVKPSNLGSSVGIAKVSDKAGLNAALVQAFQYDTKVIIEQGIKGREIECAVLGNDSPEASVPGEVIPKHEFYDYEAKYIDEHGAELRIPAELPKEKIKEIQNIVIQAFKALDCAGMARVDCFLQADGKIYINEINTLPGFTKISMYPKLWEASGLPYAKLLDKLIELAEEQKRKKDKLKRVYK